jgi:hypothetical protein
VAVHVVDVAGDLVERRVAARDGARSAFENQLFSVAARRGPTTVIHFFVNSPEFECEATTTFAAE